MQRRCPNCIDYPGRIRQTCSRCGGTGRDISCPKCKGARWEQCWCSTTGLRDIKTVDLARLLPSLAEVENTVTFYDNDTPEYDAAGPAHVLSRAQLTQILQGENAELTSHACETGWSCKVNWLQFETAEKAGHGTTSAFLTAVDAAFPKRSTSGREIQRVGSDAYIYIGSHTYGERSFNWDAGQRTVKTL
jgi:hypothetical protein